MPKTPFTYAILFAREYISIRVIIYICWKSIKLCSASRCCHFDCWPNHPRSTPLINRTPFRLLPNSRELITFNRPPAVRSGQLVPSIRMQSRCPYNPVVILKYMPPSLSLCGTCEWSTANEIPKSIFKLFGNYYLDARQNLGFPHFISLHFSYINSYTM